jgi:hypothetical protein
MVADKTWEEGSLGTCQQHDPLRKAGAWKLLSRLHIILMNPLGNVTTHQRTPMKHQPPDHPRSGEITLKPVRFEFTHPATPTFGVAGTSNDWRLKTKSRIPLGNGHCLKEMILPPGIYEYCLVVDGECIPDPLAKEDVADPFGGMKLGFAGGPGRLKCFSVRGRRIPPPT